MNKRGFHSETPVHDPSGLIDNEGRCYIFGSHMAAAESADLRYWEMFAEGVSPQNPLFSNLFDPQAGAFDYVGTFDGGEDYAVWAPDVSFNPYLQKYVMYFCTSGSFMKSCLCMATADRIKGPYTFERILLYSGFSRTTAARTNLMQVLGGQCELSRYLDSAGDYNFMKWPNCIDPNTFHDADGRFWMVYGSWSGGIFLIEIDERTGLLIHPEQNGDENLDSYFGKRLLGGNHHSIEGPDIFYDKESGYYYLFVSYGHLEREGGYQIRLFRSEHVDGPYVDMEGRTAYFVDHHEDYGVKLIGNYILPGMLRAYKSPGHNSVMLADEKLYTVYHQRFDMLYEVHEPRVHQLFRTQNGWLALCPFATDGEELESKTYTPREIHGVYYLLDHGRGITREVNQPQMVELTEDGRILLLPGTTGISTAGMQAGTMNPGLDQAGIYQLTRHAGIRFGFGKTNFEGVIVAMKDESGNPTLSITAVGGDRSVWAVRYF